MTVRHLKIFVAVCEAGSITGAGQRLFMAQPTVSQAVADLEKHYGVRLFDRISRRLHLTDAGRRLLPYARHIVSLFDEMEAGIRDWNHGGTLRLGASITIGNCLLPGLLQAFAAREPGVEVRVRIDNSEEIEQAVLENRIDFGLMEGMAHSPQVVRRAFLEDTLALLFPPQHPWASREAVAPGELKTQPLLMRERGSGGREMLESALLLHGIEVEPAWESVSTQAILRAVAEGFGVTVLPLPLAREHLARGVLCTRPIAGVPLQRSLTIIHHKDKYLTDAMRRFFGLCHTEAPRLQA